MAMYRRQARQRLRRSAVLSLLLTLMVWSVLPAGAAPFDDVPSGHWAYRALEQLTVVELVDGYPPGFFSGNRRLTRYEMALSLAGVLDRLSAAGGLTAKEAEGMFLEDLVGSYNGLDVRRALSTSEVELLRAVTAEFGPELEMLGYRAPKSRTAGPVDRGRWMLDASMSATAREMLQGGGSAADPWTAQGSPAQRIRPALRLDGGPLRGSSGSQSLDDSGRAVTIGAIGGTVLFVEDRAAGGFSARSDAPVLDGTIHLSANGPPYVGDVQPATETSPWQVTEMKAGMKELPLADNVSLTGQRTQRTSGQGDLVATQVNAQVLLGDVSIDGKLRTVEPDRLLRFDDERELGEESLGVGVTVRLGDVFLTTGQDLVQRGGDEEPREVVRSLTLEYSFTDAATVTAGWRSISDTRERTSVDVNVPVPLGALHFGLAYVEKKEPGEPISLTTLTMAGLDLKLWDNAEARAAVSLGTGAEAERATSLGLRYALNPEAALLLGYKFIDFDDVEGRKNVATAEFSIRF